MVEMRLELSRWAQRSLGRRDGAAYRDSIGFWEWHAMRVRVGISSALPKVSERYIEIEKDSKKNRRILRV